MEKAHIVLFFLALFLYGVDAGFRLFGVDGDKNILKSPLAAAFGMHTLFLALRWGVSRHAPFAGMFESISFYVWSTALAVFVYFRRAVPREVRKEVTYASLICLLFMAVASLSPKGVVPAYPALKTRWFEIHVGLSFLSYGLFTVGFCSSLAWDREKPGRYFSLCESASLMGFSLFSAGMVAGGIWAYYAWGSYWIWTPKEIFSVVLWVFYASALHAKFDGRFGLRFIRALSFAGYFVMLFTYLGVSVLLSSSHSFR
ncbi:MAG: cytochrome C biogenesis protein ResC [Deltaproteobacteria bacterium]|nr:cytochrome C biogenesis protein ResC [Deltaproteobacteria bacterium]NIS77713.1 cytochrome C biogenesis protein ResC [Deltaproteobacteria bacterium]